MKSNQQSHNAYQYREHLGTAVLIEDWSSKFNVTNGLVHGDRRLPNPILFYRTKSFTIQGSWRRYSLPDGRLRAGYRGNLGSLPPFPDGYLDGPSGQVYNEALSDLYDTVRGGIDLSIDLLQAGQTIKMLKDFGNVVRYIKKGNVRKLRRSFESLKKDPKGAVNGVGSLWLTWIYGLKPLLQTAYESFDEVMKSTLMRWVSAKGLGKSRQEGDAPWTHGFEGYGIGVSSRAYRSDRCEIEVLFRIPESRLLEFAGYTSLNPASIGWELLPWSFVADWVVDVGGYLRNLENAWLYGSAFAGGYSTETILARTFGKFSYSYGSSGSLIVCEADGGYQEYIYKRRQVLTGIPIPRVPRVDVQLGAQRLLASAALLSQFLKPNRGRGRNT